MPEPSATKLLLTLNDSAAALAISPRALWTLTSSGAIPVIRIGRSVRYDIRDLLAFIDARKQRQEHVPSELASPSSPASIEGAVCPFAPGVLPVGEH